MIEVITVTAIVSMGCGALITWGIINVIDRLRAISIRKQCNQYENKMFRTELKISFKDLEEAYNQIQKRKEEE